MSLSIMPTARVDVHKGTFNAVLKREVIDEEPVFRDIEVQLEPVTTAPEGSVRGYAERDRQITWRAYVVMEDRFREHLKKGRFLRVMAEMHPDLNRIATVEDGDQYLIVFVERVHHGSKVYDIGLTTKDA